MSDDIRNEWLKSAADIFDREYKNALEEAFDIPIGSTATTREPPTALTLEALKNAIDMIPPEPFREFMVKHGCDPNDGWVMVIPPSVAHAYGGCAPSYVQVSHYVSKPILVNDIISIKK